MGFPDLSVSCLLQPLRGNHFLLGFLRGSVLLYAAEIFDALCRSDCLAIRTLMTLSHYSARQRPNCTPLQLDWPQVSKASINK